VNAIPPRFLPPLQTSGGWHGRAAALLDHSVGVSSLRSKCWLTVPGSVLSHAAEFRTNTRSPLFVEPRILQGQASYPQINDLPGGSNSAALDLRPQRPRGTVSLSPYAHKRESFSHGYGAGGSTGLPAGTAERNKPMLASNSRPAAPMRPKVIGFRPDRAWSQSAKTVEGAFDVRVW
jgi:hypothetical protein